MGSCISRGSAGDGAVDPPAMAKIITLAGVLREYPTHLTAANVLAREEDGASCLLCSCDNLFYDYPVQPVALMEPLLPGQLYFVLPAENCRRPLTRSDVRDLLMTACSALQLAMEPAGMGARRKKRTTKGKRGSVVGPELKVVPDGCRRGGGVSGEVDEPEFAPVNRMQVVQRADPAAAQQGSQRRSGYVRCRYGYRPSRCFSGGWMGTIPEEEEV